MNKSLDQAHICADAKAAADKLAREISTHGIQSLEYAPVIICCEVQATKFHLQGCQGSVYTANFCNQQKVRL